MDRRITEDLLEEYGNYLYREEKCTATINKYLADLRKLMIYAEGNEITKELMIQYKEHLMNDGHYKSTSINSYLVAANRFFDYMGWYGLGVKTIRMQRTVFAPEERELTKNDLKKLVNTARELGRTRISMIIQTICGTGMRVSEIRYVTVNSVKKGQVTVFNKGKERIILIQRSLQKKLLAYIRKHGIKSGMLFCTSGGKPIDRSYIWREMKKLCSKSGVSEGRVFPHNLRALFAKTYYSMFKDIAMLADILGHSNIETTRIYIKKSISKHREQLDRLRLLDGLA
ncbi:MAG: tyrosine-type recombinase/integrase [Lachnospiraceae bacterium]|nr:tyrosine-type recombinase/integrase [Lachnospiraceae bacterium]